MVRASGDDCDVGEPSDVFKGPPSDSPDGVAAAGLLGRPPADLQHLLAGSGPPVVLLPGLGPQHSGFRAYHRVVQRLEVARLARSFTVWVFARPTSLDFGTTLEDLAGRYAAAIAAQFENPVPVIGTSTGGSIALQLAIQYPHVASRLVLVSAAFRLGDEGRAAQREVAEALRQGRPRRAAATMLAATTTRPAARTLRRTAGLALGRLALGTNTAELTALLDAEDGFDVESDLPRVAAPTLVIGGGRDGYYSSDLFTRTAAGVADGRAVHFRGKSHLDLTTDRSVSRTIAEFLNTDAPSRTRGRTAIPARPA